MSNIEIKKNEDGDIVGQATGIRVFDLIVNVTHYMEGKLEDWPSNIQDGIYEALERLSKRKELPLTIIDSGCGVDDYGANELSQPYIHVIASEIVVGDPRYVRDSKKEALEIAKILKSKLN
jgi:hypothetical protein